MNGPVIPLRKPLSFLILSFVAVSACVPVWAGTPVDSPLRKVPGSPISVGDGVDDLEARFDFNLDTIPDLVTCDRLSDGFAVKVHFGLGRGVFSTETSGVEFEPDEPTSVAAGLISGAGEGAAPTDTRPDIAAAVAGTIRVLENSDGGDGVADFAEVESLSVADIFLREVEVADLNGDGRADIVATGEGDDGMGNPRGKVVVFLNSETGFDAGTVLADPGTHAGRFVIGDLDEDGKLDIIAVNRTQSRVAVYLATAPGVFGNGPVLHSLGSSLIPSGIAFGHISGDEAPEILVWRTEPTSQPPNSRLIGVTELRHEGNGVLVFDSAIGFEPHPNTIQHVGDVWVADLNFDGQNDFVFTNPVTNQLMIYAVKLAPTLELNYHKSSLLFENLSSQPKRISIANLNGDQIRAGTSIVPRLDVVTANVPASPLRSVDVFLHGVDGGALPVPKLAFAKKAFGPWTFKAGTTTAVPAGAIVKLQYSATPDDPESWIDLPGGTMSALDAKNKLFLFETENLPLGEVAFRAVVTDSSTAAAGIGKASKVVKVARGIDAYVTEIKSIDPLKFGASKGSKVIFAGNNADKVTKRVDGDQGQFVWYAMSALNVGDVADTVRVQSAASAGGFLVSYFDINGTDLTAAVVGGTLTRLLGRGDSILLLMRVRVGATVPVDTVRPFALNAVSTADANIKDIACLEIEVTQPDDVVFVTNTADTGAGSLRAALVKVLERFKKKTTVRFELPVAGPGLATIPVPSDLPPIVVAANTVIDGTSQAEYREAVRGTPESGPAVELRGNGGGIGLALETSGCLVRGVQFSNFGTGMQITGLSSLGVKVKAMGNVVVGCVFEGNLNTGVHLTDGATANQIGDNETGKSNSFFSVDPAGGPVVGSHAITISGDDTDRNRVHGNVIGSLPTGTATGADVSRGFNLAAITINGGASGNQIGGRHAGEGNHIMGNSGEGSVGQFARGIEILGAGTNSNFIQGNIFGRTPAGVPRTNRGDNIVIDLGASDNIIGGTDPGTGNLVMASEGNGIAILSTNDTVATKNRIEGNQIGGYTLFEANRLAGVFVGPKAVQTAIGGEKKGAGNVVLGNGNIDPLGAGLLLTSTSTDLFTYVRGNFIGVDAANTVAGNLHGIVVRGGSAAYIGGSKDLARNVISGNIGAGVILDGTFNCSILGNRIGVGADGVVARGNGGAGVEVINAANQNYIGNIAPGFGNIIKHNGDNGDNGVRIASNSQNIAVRGNDHGNNASHMPIDLVGGTENGIGFTENDPLDPDTGANGLQNSPRITAVQVVGGKTKITLTFNSTPRTGSGGVLIGTLVIPSFALDVYADGAFVETETVNTDREGEPVKSTASTAETNGDGSYVITIPKNLGGKVISLTATVRINQFLRTIDGATSEFSNIAIP